MWQSCHKAKNTFDTYPTTTPLEYTISSSHIEGLAKTDVALIERMVALTVVPEDSVDATYGDSYNNRVTCDGVHAQFLGRIKAVGGWTEQKTITSLN